MQRDTIGRPMEILLVDDSLTAARLTIGMLKNSGIQHRLTWLRDGREALEFLNQSGRYTRAPQPDLLLLDLLMPEVGGVQVLEEIRGQNQFESLAIVIMTGAPEGRDALIPDALRVDGYLQKPINMDEFLSLLIALKDLWAADMILPDEA
jgi:CheY-like chemotaxis protein